MRGELDIQYCSLIVVEPSDPDTLLFATADDSEAEGWF